MGSGTDTFSIEEYIGLFFTGWYTFFMWKENKAGNHKRKIEFIKEILNES